MAYFLGNLAEFIPSFSAPYSFLKDLLVLSLAAAALYLGWWGWVSLWWTYLLYPQLARTPPTWVKWGYCFGASLVIVQYAAFALVDQGWQDISFSDAPEIVINAIPVLLLFGGGPLLFLLANLNAISAQRKFLVSRA